MNYSEFKDHLLIYLWKQNDLDLIGSLDNLIKMADSELNTRLAISEQENTALIYATTDTVQMPGDYDDMRSIASPKVGELTYVSPAELYTKRSYTPRQILPVYSLQGNILLLAGPFEKPNETWEGDQRVKLILTYYRKVPDFMLYDASWVADKYLALYTYTVLKHAAPFLREDERVGLWTQNYEALITQLGEVDANRRARGVQADLPLPRPASAPSSRSTMRGN